LAHAVVIVWPSVWRQQAARARRIAANIAKLPDLLQRWSSGGTALVL
jgi:hypothetical protein